MKSRDTSKSYSWWWDSHKAPKNSKWLEDNLNDMDSKVKAMLKLIEEDADSFAKRAEMYYKKRPELISLMEEFYRAYRSLAERYDQLTGHIRQIPQEIQAQFGFAGDASPGSPGSSGTVRRRAAGFSLFSSPGTPKRSKETNRKNGSDSSSSSSSDSESDSKQGKAMPSKEIFCIWEENENLRKELESVSAHQGLESRMGELQEQLKSQHQLHRNAASAHSEIATLEAEIRRLKRENHALVEEASSAVRTAEVLQKELDVSQAEQQLLATRLEETGLLVQGLEAKIKELEARIVRPTEDLHNSTVSCELLERKLAELPEETSTHFSEVSNKTSQIIELEEEIAQLQASLSLSENERDKHFEHHQSLERILADVHIKFSSVREERDGLSEKLLFKVQHAESLEEQLRQGHDALAGLEKDKAEVAELLSKAEGSLMGLQIEFSSMQERLNGVISVEIEEKDAYKQKVKELQAALASLQSEKSRGIDLQDVLEKRLVDLELQLKEATEAFVASEREKTVSGGLLRTLETCFSDLQGELGTMEVRLNAEAQEKHALNKQVEELQAALEALRGERNRGLELEGVLEKRLEDLKLQLKEAKQALESSEREKAEVAGLLRNVEDGFLKLQGEFGTLEVRLKIEAQDKQASNVQVEELEAALEALKGERSRVVEVQDVLKKRLVDLELQFKEVKEALELSEREKFDVVGFLRNVEAGFSELQGEFGVMEVRLNVETREKQALNVQVEELEIALEALKGERSRELELQDVLEKRKVDLELQLKEAKEALQSSEREKAEVTGLLRNVETGFSELQEEFGIMEVKLSDEALERQTLSMQVEQLEAALEALKGERSRGIDFQDVMEKRLVDLELQLKKAKEASESSEREKTEVAGVLKNVETSFLELQGEFATMEVRLSAEIQEKRALNIQVEELAAALGTLKEERSQGLGLQGVLEKQLMDHEQQLKQVQKALQESEREKFEVDGLLSEVKMNFSNLRDESGSIQEKLNGEIVGLAQEKQVLKKQVEELQAALDALHGDRSRGVELQDIFERRCMDLEEQLNLVKAALEQAEREKLELASTLSKVESELAELQGMLVSVQENLSSEVLTLTQEKQALTEQVEEFKATLAAVHGEKSRGIELQDVLEKRVIELQQELSQLKVEASSLSVELAEKAGLILHLEEEVSSQDEVVNSLQGDILAKNEEGKALKNELEDCHKRLPLFENEVQTLRALLTESEDRVKSFEAQVNDVQRNLELDRAKARLEASKLRSDLQDKVQLVGKQQEEIDYLKAIFEEACRGKAALELEIQGLRDDFSQVKQSKEEQSIQQLETISHLKLTISSLEVRLATSSDQLQGFEKQQVMWNQDRVSWEKTINQLAKEKEELHGTMSMWAKRMENLETEHSALKTTSRDVESSLLFHQTEHVRVKSELSEKSDKIQWLENELKRFQLELFSSQKDTRRVSVEFQEVTQGLRDQLLSEEGKVRVLHDDVVRLQQDLLAAEEARGTVLITCQEHVKEFQIKEINLESHIVNLNGKVHDLDELCREVAGKLENKTKEQEKLEAEKEELKQHLLKIQQEWERASAKSETLALELNQEHESRVTAEEASMKFQAEIVVLLEEITRLRAEGHKLKEANKSLALKVEAAMDQERVDAMEKEELLKALQEEHENNGSMNLDERTWHFEAKHSSFRHLREGMVNLLTDRSRMKQEAAAHAELVRTLNLDVQKSAEMLESARGEYHALLGRHESRLSDLQSLQLQVSRFEGQVRLLEEEKTQLRDQLLSTVKDSDDLSAELLREKKELYENLVIKGEHVLKLQQDLKLVREETIENNRIINDLQKQIKKLLLEIQAISIAKEEQGNRLTQEIQQYVEEKASAAQCLTEAHEALSIGRAEVSRYQEEISLKDQQLAKLEEELAMLRAAISIKEEEVFGLQEHRNSLETRLEVETRKWEESWTLWEEDKRTLASSCSLSEQKAMALLEQLGFLTQEKEDISLELHTRGASLNAQQQENQRLQKRLEELECSILDLKEHCNATTQKYDTTLKELERLQSQLSSLLEENGKLRQDVMSWTVSVSELTEMVASAEKSNAVLKAELKTNQENMIFLQEQFASLQLENDQLKQALKSGSQQIKMLEKEILNLRQLHSKLQSDHDSVVTDKQRSFDEHGLILLRLERVEKDLNAQQSANSHLETELRNAVARIQDLENVISKLEIEKKAFSDEIASTVQLMKDVQRRADDTQEEIDQLRQELRSRNEELQQKNVDIEDLSYQCKALQDEKTAVHLEFEVLAKKEKSYVIAVRFMRAEFLCLVQRIKSMKEEKMELARLAQAAMVAERKKNGEVMLGLQQELAVLQEESKRQSVMVFDTAEEKREAIRQLSATIDFMQNKNRHLEGVINSVREKIKRRIAASSART